MIGWPKSSIAIQAPSIQPPVHPKDKNLLRPISELGKPKYQPGGISFLRRTEYISSDTSRARAEAAVKNTSKPAGNKFRRPVDASKEDPINILRTTIKGFDVANPEDAYSGPDTKDNVCGNEPSPVEVEAWKSPRHPTKSNLKLLDAYPIKPDLDALTDSGSYMVAKFTANPSQMIEKRDSRIDVGLLHPIEMKPAAIAEYQARMAAHNANPAQNPHPGGPPFMYHFFLPADEQSAANLEKKLDVDNPDRDDNSLYTAKNAADVGAFRYEQQRIYETGRSTVGDAEHPYKEVAIALHDPELETRFSNAEYENQEDRLEKAAYYYPVLQKMQLKPHRSKTLANLGIAARLTEEEDDKLDALDVTVDNLDDDEKSKRAYHRGRLFGVNDAAGEPVES